MTLDEALPAINSSSPWALGNSVLYDLCREHPGHTKDEEILAKVWLIGRAYAVALERRRTKAEDNDSFYKQAARMIRESRIDEWLAGAREAGGASEKSTMIALGVHSDTTDLFSKISGLEKRSLASKYLHFHVPDLFFIYDSRAVAALRTLREFDRPRSPTRSASARRVDRKYHSLFDKCLILRQRIEIEHNQRLSPRQIDDLLLWVHQREGPKARPVAGTHSGPSLEIGVAEKEAERR